MKRTLITLLLASSILVLGCIGSMETEPAKPALVDSDVLEAQGWRMCGEPEVQTESMDVAGQTLTVSIATTIYGDEKLVTEIGKECRAIGVEVQEIPPSMLFTIRFSFPGGLSPPSSLINKILDERITEMTREQDIQDMHLANSMEWEINSGATAQVQVHEGTISVEGGILPVRILTTNWKADKSTVILIAVLPAGDLTVKGVGVSIPIDEDAEFDEVEALVKSIT